MSTAAVPPPPGLPPAVATHAAAKGDSRKIAAIVVVACLGYAALRGAALDTWIVGLAVVGAGFMALQNRRFELAAGPGWLSVRGTCRRRWVRTDQLVKVSDEACGVDRTLVLRDREGRKVGVLAGELRGAPAVRAQVARDVHSSVGDGLELEPTTRSHLGLA